jgi:hypothetical protein
LGFLGIEISIYPLTTVKRSPDTLNGAGALLFQSWGLGYFKNLFHTQFADSLTNLSDMMVKVSSRPLAE